MRANITSRFIATVKPTNKPNEIRDTKLKGFILRVQPSGVMSYICEYSRGNRVTIGRTEAMTPIQARDHVRELLASKMISPEITVLKKNKSKQNEPTLNEYILGEYYEWIHAHRKRATKTISQLKSAFFEQFSNLKLSELTVPIVEKWRTSRLNSGIKPSTINRDIIALKSCLSKAVEWQIITLNPLSKLKQLKENTDLNVRYLSLEEEERLRLTLRERDSLIKQKRVSGNEWRAARREQLLGDMSGLAYADHLEPMVLLSLNTGLRKSELFQLTWESIDFHKNLFVVKAAHAKSGKLRYIPMNGEAKRVLTDWSDQNGLSGLVFKNSEGKAFDSVRKSWQAVLKQAGIENFRWHDLRHHFASRLVMVGVDLNTVRELLGHADLAMTLRYAHLAPEHKVVAVSKLDAKREY